MDTLQILLLGPPDVLWRGESWKIARRLLRALLFYLAIEGVSSRETLRELFWPKEEDEQKARANLRVALARLRAELPDAEILEVSAQQVSLKRERISVDALQFNDLSGHPLRTAAQLPPSSPLPERFSRQLSQAAGLWRSPHFLEGLNLADDNPGLDHWLSATRQRFEETYHRVLLRLADNAALTGDHDRAIHWGQAALQIDPWSEELQAKVMRWMMGLGRFSAAASFAQDLQARYDHENEKLSPALSELVLQARGAGRAKNGFVEGWPAELLIQVPLVGRDDEMKALQDAHRRGGIVLLRGEAGCGKTRLVYEFYRRLQPRPRLLVLHASQSDHDLPFQALIDALRRSIHPQEWERMPAAWQRSLAFLLPELAQASPQPLQPEPTQSAVLRGQLFEALRGLLVELFTKERLLVVLDSAQWCDADTQAALAYLVEHRLFSERCLMVITTRIEEPLSVLGPVLAAQRGSVWFSQIDLENLSLEETASLAREVLEFALAEDQVKVLCEQTGGNPLFLLESLYTALEFPAAAQNKLNLDRLPVSGSLHGLLRERLSGLRPLARQVAAAAAVMGGEFTLGQLEALTLLGAEEVTQALDELEGAHLTQAAPDAAQAAYTFIHGQVREVIQWEEGQARLRLLHLRAARILEAQQAESSRLDALLAQHYEAAGELNKAVRYWVKAGMRARGLFSVKTSESAFQSAGRLAQRIQKDVPEDVLYQLYTQWGEIAAEQGDSPRMDEIYRRLLRAGEERQSSLLVGGALSGLAEMYAQRGEATQALDLFQRAGFHLQQVENPAALAQCYNRQGYYLVRQLRFPEAIAVLEKANALVAGGDSTAMREVRVHTEYFLGLAYNQTGWPAKAEEIAARSLRQEPPEHSVYGHLVMAIAKHFQDDNPASLEHSRLGLQMAQQLASPRLMGYFSVIQVRAELALGQLDSAWEDLRTIADQARVYGHQDFLSIAHCMTGYMFRSLGATEKAIQAYRSGLEASTGKWDTLEGQYHLGLALAEAGDLEEGLQLAEAAYRRASALGLGVVASPALTAWFYLLARVGRHEEALQRIAEWKETYQGRGFGSGEIIVSWALSMVAQQHGELGEAQRQADLAIERARQLGNPWWELQGYRFLKWAGGLGGSAQARVLALLAGIDRSVRHPKLRGLVETRLADMKIALLSG